MMSYKIAQIKEQGVIFTVVKIKNPDDEILKKESWFDKCISHIPPKYIGDVLVIIENANGELSKYQMCREDLWKWCVDNKEKLDIVTLNNLVIII